MWGTAGPGFSSYEQVDVRGGFSPSCCSTTPIQINLCFQLERISVSLWIDFFFFSLLLFNQLQSFFDSSYSW